MTQKRVCQYPLLYPLLTAIQELT